MSTFEFESAAPRTERTAMPIADIDVALTAQLLVAWAGETGDDKRLGWWRSDLISQYGGEDLFRRLLPSTWEWAVLQGAREAARRRDAELRRPDHDPDRIVSLFNLGVEVDERIADRFQELKRSGRSPQDALPGLAAMQAGWRREAFLAWVRGHGDADATPAPIGRRLKGSPPSDLPALVAKLVAALAPVEDTYPLPHYRRSP